MKFLRRGMRRVFTLLILSCLTVGSWAQTQQGFVKTLGRPDKKGVALSGVIVRVKGEHNAVQSQQDGTFSMLLTGKKNGDDYQLQQVQKTGYELNEKEVVGRQYAFSDKAPLTIVMVSTVQLQAVKQRIENNAYQEAEKNYKKRLALLEQQRESNAITAEQYRQQLQDLQDKFEKYQSLIDNLSDHYAHVDYDNLDEKDREINLCIENGDLERADSLIHTLFNPIDVLRRNKDALSKIDQQVKQAEGIIAQANADMSAVLKQQEKDAEYLYQLYTIALARLDNEKARLYIETRAELDTTNVLWQLNAGSVLEDAANYEKAIMYNQRALANTSPNQAQYIYRGTVLNNIGCIFQVQSRYKEALTCFEKAKDFDIMIWGDDNVALVKVYNNLGLVFEEMEDFSKALENYNKALEIETKINPKGSKDIAMLNNNIGGLYRALGERDKSIEYVETALILYKHFCGEQSSEVAMAYGNLADNLYGEQALQYVMKALDIYLKLYGENHPNVAWCYGIMGSAFYHLEQPQKGEEYYMKSLSIYRFFYGETHSRVGIDYRVMSLLSLEKGDYVKAEDYNQKALGIFKVVYGDYHSTVASCYNTMGAILTMQDKPTEAAAYVDKAVSVMERKYPEGHPDLYIYYLSQGCYRLGQQTGDSTNYVKNRPLDGQMSDYGAEESLSKLLAITEKFYIDNPQKMQNAVQCLAFVYFSKLAVGATEYKEKLRVLSEKHPQYVKAALESMKQMIPQ